MRTILIPRILLTILFMVAAFLPELSGCSKTEPCRPGTIFLTFKCTSDAIPFDAAKIELSNGTDVASYNVSIDCGKEASLEVIIPTFAQGGNVRVSGQGLSQGAAVGSLVEFDIPLVGKCQSRDIQLDLLSDADAATSSDTATDSDPRTDSSPACRLGGEGCGCNGGICDDGLQCKNSTCRRGSCGDGVMDPDETCDDANNSDSDSCTNRCAIAACGDGVVQAGIEACDDGNTVDTDACTSQCKAAKCGDGLVQSGEECDTAAVDNTGSCLPSCKAAKCGDGFVQSGVESCDDGNAIDTDGCSNNCKSAACGNGLQEANEQCDDGNTSNLDGCLNSCTPAKCGDGFVRQGVEVCDDGNGTNTDACTNMCKAASCGDGFAQPGEDCDDGNQVDNDLCSNACVGCSKRAGHLQCGQTCIASAQCCPSSVCAAAACSGASVSPARVCSGTGQCPSAAAQACGNYLTCMDSVSCRTGCTSDSECVGGRACQVATGRCLVRSTVVVPAIAALSGFVSGVGSSTGLVVPLVVGDDSDAIPSRGIVSFDLQAVSVAFVAIEKAVLTAKLILVEGSPFSSLGTVRAEHITFESAANAFNAPSLGNGALLANSGDIGSRAIDVTAALADDYANRNARGGRAQFRFQFAAQTDGDSVQDTVWFSNGGNYGPNVVLELTVLSP